jgi:hypothetical protein
MDARDAASRCLTASSIAAERYRTLAGHHLSADAKNVN